MSKTQAIQRQEPNDRKLQELVLFVCQRSDGDPRFGATKLNKHLFFADFLAYKQFGKSITGQQYRRLQNGPVPRRLPPLMQQLNDTGAIAQATHDYYGYVQKRTYALRDPDLTSFSPQEVALVTELIEEFWGKNATEMSVLSHGFVGYEVAREQEDIPYQVALIARREPTPEEREYAANLEPMAEECLSRNAQ